MQLQSTVVALDAIAGVLLGVVERVGKEFFDDGLEGLGGIGDDPVWCLVSVECTVEERAIGSKIAAW